MAVALIVLVSVGIPLLFLVAVRRLDLYASGSFQVIVWCAGAGLAAFPVSYVINNAARDILIDRAGATTTAATAAATASALLMVRTVIAPVVEEIAKSAGLWHAVRRRDFTYFVDGAICGFAAGTSFAIVENLFYATRAGLGTHIGQSVNRALSTSLVHGTASALVGVSAGRFRFGHSGRRAAALAAGWAVAIALHMAFNRAVTRTAFSSTVLAIAIAIGIGGFAAIAVIVRLGLREERQWLRRSLDLAVGVTGGEARAVDRMADLKALLAPIAERFGEAKRQQVEALLRSQARLGLKQEAARRAAAANDAKLSSALAADAQALQEEHDRLRRSVGVYCMTYVRSILPSDNTPLWARLSAELAAPRASGGDLWGTLGGRIDPPAGPSRT